MHCREVAKRYADFQYFYTPHILEDTQGVGATGTSPAGVPKEQTVPEHVTTLIRLECKRVIDYPYFVVMVYDMTHYATHHFPMRWGFLKDVKRHHMVHHYKTPDQLFGVSSPLWDHVFGTYVTG